MVLRSRTRLMQWLALVCGPCARSGVRSIREARPRRGPSSSDGALDRPHRLFGQLVERDDRQFEVVLFRVFEFVVAEAVEALDEHHHAGDAGARHLGGIVQRA